MKKLSYLLFVVTALMLSLSSCNNKNEGDEFEIVVDNSRSYTFDANGQIKVPFEVYPNDAKLLDMGIRCMSYTKRTNDPANMTTLKTVSPKVMSLEMDPKNPSGRLAVIVIVDANGKRFVPNSAYFYNFNFKASYLYKGMNLSNDFAMEYSYGVEPTRR